MNFWTTERFTNALQVVGNIIAPLPDDFPEETRNLDDDNRNFRDDNEENLERIEYNDDNNEDNREDNREEREGNEKDNLGGVDEIEIEIEGDIESVEKRHENTHQNLQQSRSESDDFLHRVDSSQSDWSPKDNRRKQFDSDTESNYSDNSSPLYRNPPSLPNSEDQPIVDSMNQLSEDLSSNSIESLQHELMMYKSKTFAAFAEISSLSDNLRESISQNREYERKLEREEETQRMLLSRIDTLSQSKEQLALQLSEVLESIERDKRLVRQTEIDKKNEQAASQELSNRYELIVIENQQLKESLLSLEKEFQSKTQNQMNEYHSKYQMISTGIFQLLEAMNGLVNKPMPQGTPGELTEQSLCDMVREARETMVLYKSNIILEKNNELESSQREISSLQHLRQLTESKLQTESDLCQQLKEKNNELEQQLILHSNRRQEEENILTQKYQQQLQTYLDHIKSLELEIYKGKEQRNAEFIANTIVTPQNIPHDQLHSLQVQLERYQQERVSFFEFCQFCESSNQPNSPSTQDVSLLNSLERLRQRWTQLMSSNETYEQEKVKLIHQQEELLTKYNSALQSLNQVTHERDVIQKQLQDFQSIDAEKKKTLLDSKMKIEELLKKIYEMKQLKEENDALKLNIEQLTTENKREIIRLESDNRQLHQVVSQLRNARRTTQENADTALADRQSYLETIEQQRRELLTLREKVVDYDSIKEVKSQLSEEVMVLKDTIQLMKTDYETRLTSTTTLYQTVQRQLSDKERMIYDLESQLESTLSDLKVTQKELSSRLKELDNFHQVIQTIERENTQNIHRLEVNWKEKIHKIENEMKNNQMTEFQVIQTRVQQLQEELFESQRQLEDEKLLKRKFEIEMITEKKKLHTTLQHALSQLQNSQNDSIDRLLIKNLIIRYFQQKRSLEVLSIIARVLQFSDEDKVTVGLEVPAGSIITTLFQSFANPLLGIVSQPAATTAAPPPVEGGNLAEMWLNYLIHESEEEDHSNVGQQGSSSLSPSPPKPLPTHNTIEISSTPISPLHRSYSIPLSSPSPSPSPSASLNNEGNFFNGSTPPSRMPNFLNKPTNIRMSSDEMEAEQMNGVRQIAPSPVLYPHHNK